LGSEVSLPAGPVTTAQAKPDRMRSRFLLTIIKFGETGMAVDTLSIIKPDVVIL
jgi:hypothetical protein